MELKVYLPETREYYNSNLDVLWNIYRMVDKNPAIKQLPEDITETLKFITDENKISFTKVGLYNEKTHQIDPLTSEQIKEIKSLPDFSKIILHEYFGLKYNTQTNYYDGSSKCAFGIREITAFVLDGKLYSQKMLDDFTILYKTRTLKEKIYTEMLEKLSKNYDIYVDTVGYGTINILLFDGDYEIEVDTKNDTVCEKIPKGSNKDLACFVDQYLDGVQSCYDFLKNTPDGIKKRLNKMLVPTTYEQIDTDYTWDKYDERFTHIIDFTKYNKNLLAIQNLLDEIDKRYYKLTGKHFIKKKVKELD